MTVVNFDLPRHILTVGDEVGVTSQHERSPPPDAVPHAAPEVVDLRIGDIERNQQIEADISRFASESLAAHRTADALLATLNRLFLLIEDNELRASSRMLLSYTRDTPSFGVVGQLGAGGFSRIMSQARGDAGLASRDTQEPVALREKVTAFYNLTNSAYFRETMEQIYRSPTLKNRASAIVDIAYLETRQFAPARGARNEPSLPDQLALYTYDNENAHDASENVDLYEKVDHVAGQSVVTNPARAGGSLTRAQNEFREKTEYADNIWAVASDLRNEQRITAREIAFAKLNPRNRVDSGDGAVKGFQARQDDETFVMRGNGVFVWRVKEESGFFKDAQLQNKPTVAGPSGTTDRFMTAARLLKPGLIGELRLHQERAGEAPVEGMAREEREMKELVRWMAVGYLVDDNHHSMIEVNLGAANHGLPVQWGDALYLEAFEAPIETDDFTISSAEVVRTVAARPPVTSHYESFRYDFAGGSLAQVTPDGRVLDAARKR